MKLNTLNIYVPGPGDIYTILFICTPVYTECESGVDSCENGGICRKLGSSYTCECINGYSGLSCENG